ncbi:gonadotropin-releasing hormone receptor-like [Diadema antillarum]|uniref:gonadotropin-releasing hormone receptor-like n=1 Tax=Diadema antillarum TaxID=105358 RepID=UPI003A8BB6EE
MANVFDASLSTSHPERTESGEGWSTSPSMNDSLMHFIPTVDGLSLGKVLALCVMIVVSTIGNVATVVITCRLRRRRKSTVTLLVLHLAISDLLVTYTHMLPHAIWYAVIQWYGGDFLCKLVKFFSSFGLFLSSFLTVDISLDHCMAVFYPLAKTQRPRKAKIMIIMSYVFAAFFSIPQMPLFYSERAPFQVVFYQCVTIRKLTLLGGKIYTTLVLFVQVVAPLNIMFAAYIAIFIKIRRESFKGLSVSDAEDNISQQRKARSRLFMRAQHRTLRMIITIFLAFVLNWTPYVLATMIYIWNQSEHPDKMGHRVAYEVAFLFGLSNSCFNPLVYGCCNLHYFDSMCASCCAIFIGRLEASQSGHDQKTSTYIMRWSVKSSPTAKQGYGHHHPHLNNSVNRHGNANHGGNSQWIKGRLVNDGAPSSTSQVTVS